MDDEVTREYEPGATYSAGGNNFNSSALPGQNSNLLSLRSFIVGYQVLTGVPFTVSASIKTVQMNCLYQITGSPTSAGEVQSTAGGWFINCIWDVSDPSDLERYFFNAVSSVPTVYLLYNSFYLNGASNAPYQTWDIVVNSNNYNSTFYSANNVFAGVGQRPINLNIVNNANHLLSNAYYNVNNPSSYSGDPYPTVLTSAPNLLSAPSAGSPLIGAAEPSTFGYTVD